MNKLLLNIPLLIETPKLKLQLPTQGQGDLLYSAIRDGYEDYIKWLHWSPTIPSHEKIEEECRKHHAEFILRECIRYLIVEKETNEIIGRCAFPPTQTNWMIPQFGISYFIRKSKRRKGYATESAHALTHLAFSILKAQKVEIHCDQDNYASTQVPLKLGFTLEYTQKGNWLTDEGKLANLNTYSIFNFEDLPQLEIKYNT